MDIVYQLGAASAKQVQARMSGTPAYSTVRAMLARLETKRHLTHREDGPRYIYSPATAPSKARRSALDRVIDVFYEGSVAKAVMGLVGGAKRLSAEELEEIEAAIRQARENVEPERPKQALPKQNSPKRKRGS